METLDGLTSSRPSWIGRSAKSAMFLSGDELLRPISRILVSSSDVRGRLKERGLYFGQPFQKCM